MGTGSAPPRQRHLCGPTVFKYWDRRCAWLKLSPWEEHMYECSWMPLKSKRSPPGNDSVGGNFVVPHPTTETNLYIWVRSSWKFWIDDREVVTPSRTSGLGQSARTYRSAHKHHFRWTLGSGNYFFRCTCPSKNFVSSCPHEAITNMEWYCMTCFADLMTTVVAFFDSFFLQKKPNVETLKNWSTTFNWRIRSATQTSWAALIE